MNRSSFFATSLAVSLASGHFIFLFIPCLLFGPDGRLYVAPLLASLTALLIVLWCRSHVGGWSALAAALVYAVNPAANQQAFNWGAHPTVTFFLVVGLIVLGSWHRSPAV